MAKLKNLNSQRGFHYHIDPEATAHDLMNEATEWLQYARSLTRLVADFIHESDAVDCQRVAHGLEAIDALMHMGAVRGTGPCADVLGAARTLAARVIDLERTESTIGPRLTTQLWH